MGFKLFCEKIGYGMASIISLVGYKMIALHCLERQPIHGTPVKGIFHKGKPIV
jgi:hypothetical protein